jgi:hypothetical protein
MTRITPLVSHHRPVPKRRHISGAGNARANGTQYITGLGNARPIKPDKYSLSVCTA